MKRRPDTGKWEVRWRENGRNRSKSFSRKSDAERFELDVRRSRELGRPLDIDRGRETLAEFVGTYWKRYAVVKLSEKTRADYRGVWSRHVRRVLGGYRLRDVTPAVVDGFQADLRVAGVGEATVAKALTLLSSMFRCAVTWDRVDRNPLREIKIPQPKRARLVRPIPPERVEAMRLRLLVDERIADAVLLSVLAYAGLRPQEARALQWGDVGERTLVIERAAAGSAVKATKTEAPRTVRLLAPLARDLQRWREEAGSPQDGVLVFPSSRGGLMTDDDWRNWRKRVFGPAATAAGIDGSRPYDLRHSFASLLIREGASAVSVAAQMGNAPSVTLDTYAHLLDEREPTLVMDPAAAIEAARGEFDVRGVYAEGFGRDQAEPPDPASEAEALYQTRTDDPLLTMEVLYQLS